MGIGEIIKTGRECLGMTQEDLAEKLDVSRQAVSKWELGASIPSPENLHMLEEVLAVTFPQEPALEPEPVSAKPATPWKIIALVLGGLFLAALALIICLILDVRDTSEFQMADMGPPQIEPAITGVYFFQEDGTPLNPNLGDGWCSFNVGQRVLLLVTFQHGAETAVVGVSLFATPTGTETYNEREQLAVQAVYDRPFALFSLDFPEQTMYHLDVTLECAGGQNIIETLNVTAVPEEFNTMRQSEG